MYSSCSVLLYIFLIISVNCNQNEDGGKKSKFNPAVILNWAQKLGGELFNFGEYITKMRQIEENYKNAKVHPRNGKELLDDIVKEIQLMMEMKMSAVRRIMDAAENSAMSEIDKVPQDYVYYNAKSLVPPRKSENETIKEEHQEMNLTANEHFYNVPVNISYSAVHVPTNVYDRSHDVIKAIKWSENLDSIFKNNYDMDPSLSWQYFGSSSGFMRQFPAMEWKQDYVDLFDCRTRSWYIEAATSPKDIVILVDNSGSMTGMRKEIARHVVNNILDTLGNNDFVNIFMFSNDTQEVVVCFKNLLVQATLANIRELKLGMEKIETQNIANFTAALVKAFELLAVYRDEKEGARCNQAIMLVTDGVPYNYKETFELYNWKNNKPVRVFTYLIGREVADVREVKWMACANQGYYVHLSTLAEVREQVLQYVPVMARPMVLWKSDHPTIWTPVYADVTDPKMTDWLWEVKEREEQRQYMQGYRKDKYLFTSKEEQDKRFEQKLKRMQDQHGDLKKYKLMTSVSMPVFDRRENAVSSDPQTNSTRVANLLGVAGTDVPIQEIEQLMVPHKLGVNAYAFIVTNNGYILTHPDLRPVFQGILKPSYNSVDMVEVELVDDNREPRDFDPQLLALRDAIINQSDGNRTLQTKYHFDDMKRVSRVKRNYYYTGIKNTTFSLVVAIPEPHGLSYIEFSTLVDVHRQVVEGSHITDYFNENWTIHPDWVYCKYWHCDGDKKENCSTPEKQLIHFLDRMSNEKWKWLKRTAFPPEMSNSSTGKMGTDREYYCDRQLLQSLVNDANVTLLFSNNITDTPKEDKREEFIQRYGLTITFVATHSGLTRWKDYQRIKNEPHFSEIHKRAIDEIWYKRAVEQYYITPNSFVYSVPIDAGNKSDTLVTASHAIFKYGDTKETKAPVAVVGFQFRHSALFTLFKNITSNCGEQKPCQSDTCSSDDITCYVLDDNGYVVVSESMEDTGKFFGEINGYIMERMVQENFYRKINIYDYQAVCFEEPEISSPASIIITPLQHVMQLFEWIISYTVWLIVQSSLIVSDNYVYSYPSEGYVYDEMDPDPTAASDQPSNKGNEKENDKKIYQINRTRPKPCDRKVALYQLKIPEKKSKTNKPFGVLPLPCDSNRKIPFIVELITNSNLALLVIDATCPNTDSEKGTIIIKTEPIDANQSNDSFACYKVKNNQLPRRRPPSCINSHKNESEIKLCGKGNNISLSAFPMLLIATLLIVK